MNSGECPNHSSQGVFSIPFLIYTLFRVYTTVLTASLQNFLETLFSNNIALATSTIDLFLLLEIPFFSGVLGEDSCLLIPFFLQNMLSYLEVNSPHLSYLKHVILNTCFILNSILKYHKLLKSFKFLFKKCYPHHSSEIIKKIIKYFSP